MKVQYAIIMTVASTLIAVIIQESRIAALQKRLIADEHTSPSASAPVSAQTARGIANEPEKRKERKLSHSQVSSEKMHTSKNPLEEGASMSDDVKKMWDNPAGKAMMSQGLKTGAKMMYQDFIDQLQLNKEEGDYLMNLLVNGMVDQQGLGMKLLSGDHDGQAKVIADIEKKQKENEAEIKKFLNNEEDWQAFEKYKNTMPERQQLDGIRASMQEKNLTLDASTEEKLLDAMYKARKEANGVDLHDPKSIEQLGDSKFIERFEKDWEQQQERLRKETKQFLNAEQALAFDSYQKQSKELQIMQLRMSQKFMPKDSEEKKQ